MNFISMSKSENDNALNWLKSVDPSLNCNAEDSQKTKLVVEKFSDQKEKYILSFSGFNDVSMAYLHKFGHKHLYGIDSNKKIYDMPYYTQIKYSYSPLDYTHLPDCFFDVICNIKTDMFQNVDRVKNFMNEAMRMLSNGGILAFAINYSAGNKNANEFSSSDISDLLNYASGIGFTEQQHLALPSNNCIIFMEFKLSKNHKHNSFNQINIINATLDKDDGMDICEKNLKRRFEELGIKASLYKTYDEADKNYMTIIGYVPAFVSNYGLTFPENGKYLIDAHQTQSPARFTLEVKNVLKRIAAHPTDIFSVAKLLISHPKYSLQTVDRLKTTDNKELEKHFLVLRTNELAEHSGFKDYLVMPHPTFGIPLKNTEKQNEIHLGSFGFATKSKNFDQICELAKRLNVKATIWLGSSKFNTQTESTNSYIANEIYKKYNSDNIRIRIKQFNRSDILNGELKDCTHFISAQSEAWTTSASLRDMVLLGKPVISVDNYLAREAQVHRVKSLDYITIEYLKNTTETTNLDDGFRYLIKILDHVDFSQSSFKRPVQ